LVETGQNHEETLARRFYDRLLALPLETCGQFA